MAKDKALSIDGVSDSIFKKNTWKKIWRESVNRGDQRENVRRQEERKNEERGIKEIERKLV